MDLGAGWSLSPDELLAGIRFVRRLSAYLRRPWHPQEAQAALARRLKHRESGFLGIVRRCIYRNRSSPYRKLLDRAGCEYGDIARSVARDGIEDTLAQLYKAGVFLTVEEFKGRQPVVRGSATLSLSPERFRNPLSMMHVAMKSGGSRSQGTPVVFDLDFIKDCALNTGLALHMRGGDGWLKSTWEVPGGGALFSLLEFSKFGLPPARWFSQLDPDRKELDPRYRWINRALKWGASLAGIPMPPPQYVPLEDPTPIVRWLSGFLKEGKTPYLLTYPSCALRVCQTALDAGIDLEGAHITIAGEPCTQRRLDIIRSTGATVFPKYAIMETGPVGYGCLAPEASDDIHLMSDLHAVIRAGERDENGLPPGSLLFTSLMPSAPIVLLNVSMGDQADLVRRSCNCPLAKLGWDLHLHSIQSFEKLTCGGMSFMDSDIVRILDEVLPARFGGGPTDYQVVEGEEVSGDPMLTLIARPRLGTLDEREVIQAFIQGVSHGGGANAVMGMAWTAGRRVRLERREPMATGSGKILHLHAKTRGTPAGHAESGKS
ncbi:hypothetical protein ACFLU6_04050 [Acidobacteriota bacterium]